MRHEPSILARWFWRVAAGLLLFGQSLTARGELIDQVKDALSLRDSQNRFHLQLSGLVDLETYFLDQPAPALIYTKQDFLFNPRLTLFLDAQFETHLYLFVQARVDRGFDPADEAAEVRADEYFLRYTPLDNTRINIQIGKFATVVGNWVERHDSWLNPFINAPLPYEHLTGIWDSSPPGVPDTLLYWAHTKGYDSGDYSDKNMRNPIIWGPSYATGASVFGTIGKFDYAAEIKNGALSSRPEYWDATKLDFENPTFSTRVGVRPNQMWNFGFSASAGPYLLPEAGPWMPPGRDVGEYCQLVLAQDISFAWRHLQIWAEFYESRFEIPLIGNADTFAYYLEAKYKITPQLFGALRWNQQLFGTIRDEDHRAQWGSDTWRIDAAVGYRFTRYLQGKAQYSFTHQDAQYHRGNNLFALQLTLKF